MISMTNGAGKGDRYRPVDFDKYSQGWDLAFGKEKKMGGVKNTAYGCWEMAQGEENPDWDKIAKANGLPDAKTAEAWASEWDKLEDERA